MFLFVVSQLPTLLNLWTTLKKVLMPVPSLSSEKRERKDSEKTAHYKQSNAVNGIVVNGVTH